MRIETGIKIFVILTWVCIAICGALLAWQFWYAHTGYIDPGRIKHKKILANRTLEGSGLQNCLTRHCPTKGCKNLEDWKDAYDRVFGTDTACAVAIYKTNPFRLQENVPNPRNEICYSHLDESTIYNQEGVAVDAAKKLLRNLEMPPVRAKGQFLVPKKLNFVWMTSRNEFKTRPNAFFKINPYVFHNTKITPHWQHTLWTNDVALIPPQVKQQLTEHNITIKSINELQIRNPIHIALKDLAIRYAQREDWARTSDIARDLVEYYEGGVYADGDYKLINVPRLELYMQSYRSFFGTNLAQPLKNIPEVINAFLASEPHGNVLKRKLALVHRNLANKNKAPMYIQYPCRCFDAILTQTGPVSLSVAFLQAHNSEDALLPFYSMFPLPLHFPGMWPHLGKDKLGAHDSQGSWGGARPFIPFVY